MKRYFSLFLFLIVGTAITSDVHPEWMSLEPEDRELAFHLNQVHDIRNVIAKHVFTYRATQLLRHWDHQQKETFIKHFAFLKVYPEMIEDILLEMMRHAPELFQEKQGVFSVDALFDYLAIDQASSSVVSEKPLALVLKKAFSLQDALFKAIEDKDECSVNDLIGQYVPINARNINQRTPLMVATVMRAGNIVQKLVDAGANIHLMDEKNKTAAMIALDYSCSGHTLIATSRYRVDSPRTIITKARDNELKEKRSKI